MDQESEISVQKEGKLLEIEVQSGSLFFNITQQLKDDETVIIRTSTMMVGIRGACGWVEAPNEGTIRLFLLEGTAECTAGTNSATVQAGEMAVMTEDGGITVEKFAATDVPAFVWEEAEDEIGRAHV